MCLAQGHNAATPVRLEPADPRSRVHFYLIAAAIFVYIFIWLNSMD